jgi:hypothetical protein
MKLKYFVIYLFLILSFSSCFQTKKDDFSESIVIPKENIKALLDSFVQENKSDNYVYELYIDKMDPDSYNLLLYAGEKSLTEKENDIYRQTSINGVVCHGKTISIYSGVEHYFASQRKEKELEGNVQINTIKQVMWAIKDSSGILTIYSIDGGYPFLPFPLRNEPGTFSSPIVDSD